MSVTISGIDTPRPHGLQEILLRFNDPFPLIDNMGKVDPIWEQHTLRLAKFPAPLPLSYAPNTMVIRFRHHRRIGHIVNVYDEIYQKGLWDKLPPFGGCYEFRAKRTSKGLHLSTHCWGIAVDHPPGTIWMPKVSDETVTLVTEQLLGDILADKMEDGKRMFLYERLIHPKIIDIFTKYGFHHGRAFDDEMHFQYATGY